MRIDIIGVLLIVIGVLIFAYEGFSYTKQESVAQIGDLKLTAETRERVYLSPVLGGISLAAGLALVIMGRRKG